MGGEDGGPGAARQHLPEGLGRLERCQGVEPIGVDHHRQVDRLQQRGHRRRHRGRPAQSRAHDHRPAAVGGIGRRLVPAAGGQLHPDRLTGRNRLDRQAWNAEAHVARPGPHGGPGHQRGGAQHPGCAGHHQHRVLPFVPVAGPARQPGDVSVLDQPCRRHLVDTGAEPDVGHFDRPASLRALAQQQTRLVGLKGHSHRGANRTAGPAGPAQTGRCLRPRTAAGALVGPGKPGKAGVTGKAGRDVDRQYRCPRPGRAARRCLASPCRRRRR